MACLTCNQIANTPVTGSFNGTQVFNHSDCQGVSVDLLTMFSNIVTCTKTNNRLAEAQITPQEADDTLALLALWITAKQADPATCDYHDKLAVVQAIVQKAILTGTC